MKEPQPDHQIKPTDVNDYKKDDIRPAAIKLLALSALILAIWNGLRLVQGIIFWSILEGYKARPGPMYITISGGIWLLVGLIISWGAWERKFWARYAVVAGTFFYATWYWFDRLIFQRSHSNWLYALVATLILITIPFILLLSHGPTHSFSKGNYERKSKV